MNVFGGYIGISLSVRPYVRYCEVRVSVHLVSVGSHSIHLVGIGLGLGISVFSKSACRVALNKEHFNPTSSAYLSVYKIIVILYCNLLLQF